MIITRAGVSPTIAKQEDRLRAVCPKALGQVTHIVIDGKSAPATIVGLDIRGTYPVIVKHLPTGKFYKVGFDRLDPFFS